jgi:GDP-L-fucose synthase
MPRKALDASRLAALGWRPRVPLEEGLAATYRSFLQVGEMQMHEVEA